MIAISGVTIVLGLGQLILDAIQPIVQIPVNFIDQFQTLKWPITLVALFVIMFLIYLIVPNAQLKLKTIIPVRSSLLSAGCCYHKCLVSMPDILQRGSAVIRS